MPKAGITRRLELLTKQARLIELPEEPRRQGAEVQERVAADREARRNTDDVLGAAEAVRTDDGDVAANAADQAGLTRATEDRELWTKDAQAARESDRHAMDHEERRRVRAAGAIEDQALFGDVAVAAADADAGKQVLAEPQPIAEPGPGRSHGERPRERHIETNVEINMKRSGADSVRLQIR